MQEKLIALLNDKDLKVTGMFIIKLSNGKEYYYSANSGKMVDSELEVLPIIKPGETADSKSNSLYTSGDFKAVVPSEYTVSNKEGETSIENGLVIKKDGNEWVWVVVTPTDLSMMYEEDKTGWTMSGTEGENKVITKYRTISTTDFEKNKGRSNPGENGHREPDVLNDERTDQKEGLRNNGGFGTYTEMAIQLRDDYKSIIDSIKKYGGFYIGRYELSNDGVKKEKNPKTGTNWYMLYKECKKFGSNGVESRMILGCQWDQVCRFVHNYGDKVSLTDSRTYGNHQDSLSPANVDGYGSLQVTGFSEKWKINNIYDLAGNCWEWTQEAVGSMYRISRGGSYNINGGNGYSDKNIISYSDGIYSNQGWNTFTSRPVLIIK